MERTNALNKKFKTALSYTRVRPTYPLLSTVLRASTPDKESDKALTFNGGDLIGAIGSSYGLMVKIAIPHTMLSGGSDLKIMRHYYITSSVVSRLCAQDTVSHCSS